MKQIKWVENPREREGMEGFPKKLWVVGLR